MQRKQQLNGYRASNSLYYYVQLIHTASDAECFQSFFISVSFPINSDSWNCFSGTSCALKVWCSILPFLSFLHMFLVILQVILSFSIFYILTLSTHGNFLSWILTAGSSSIEYTNYKKD